MYKQFSATIPWYYFSYNRPLSKWFWVFPPFFLVSYNFIWLGLVTIDLCFWYWWTQDNLGAWWLMLHMGLIEILGNLVWSLFETCASVFTLFFLLNVDFQMHLDAALKWKVIDCWIGLDGEPLIWDWNFVSGQWHCLVLGCRLLVDIETMSFVCNFPKLMNRIELK